MEKLDILSMVLPEAILDYFKVLKSAKSSTLLEIWSEENPVKSIDSTPVHSNGFYKSIIVKDFQFAPSRFIFIFVVVVGLIR